MSSLLPSRAWAALLGWSLAAGLAAFVPAALNAQPRPTVASAPHRNVYQAAGEVRPLAAVQGDFVAAGGRVLVDQPVGGDLLAAGGAVEVRAAIGEDVRAVGGDVAIESRIGGELFAAGGHVALRPGTVVAGRAALYGGTVSLNGRVDGELEVAAQKVVIDGEVQGDVHIAAEDIELGPATRIQGTLRYASASDLKRADGARVTGLIVREAPSEAQRRAAPARGSDGAFRAGGVFSYLALLACATVFLLLAPGFTAQAPRRIQARPWHALGAGLLALFALPLIAILLFITLLGIPLGLAVMAVAPVLLLAGFLVGVLSLAGLLPPALGRPVPAGLRGTLGWFALALVLVLLIARVPFVGGLAMALVSLAGLGACLLEVGARRKGPPAGEGSAAPVLPLHESPRHA